MTTTRVASTNLRGNVTAGDTFDLDGAGRIELRVSGFDLFGSKGVVFTTAGGPAPYDTHRIGTEGDDDLFGTAGPDIISGATGNDYLYGLAGDDSLNGGEGVDVMAGGTGNDKYYVDNRDDIVWEFSNQGNDTVFSFGYEYTLPANVEALVLLEGNVNIPSQATNGTGNAGDNSITGNFRSNVLSGLAGNDTLSGEGGFDFLYGGAGNDTIDGGLGADVMAGGTGDDAYGVDNVGDVVWEWGGEGIDTVYAIVDFTLGAGVENLACRLNGTGNNLDNVITSIYFDESNVLSGLGGDDLISSGGGDDVLIGGTGRDRLGGGFDADRFVWNSADETGTTVATMDRIEDFDFAEGDRIDLSLIDANSYAAGNQPFTFIGQAAFSGTPGEINYVHVGDETIIQMQTGMDPDIEGGIVLAGLHTPDASWFVL